MLILKMNIPELARGHLRAKMENLVKPGCDEA